MSHSYLLLLHENPASYAGMSADEMQEIVARYAAWAREMAAQGHLAGGEKLAEDGGRQLRLAANGQPVASDGPYAEAHDVIGGYFVLKADSDAQAEALATSCPHLNGRNWIELRRIDPLA